MKVEDFKVLGKLPAVYELKPEMHYLVIADGKKFPYRLAEALLEKAKQDGYNVHVIATLYPGSLKVGTGTVSDGEDDPADAGAADESGKKGNPKV